MKRSLVIVSLIVIAIGIDCQKNHPPIINSIIANPDSVNPGQGTTLTADANDPDGDALTYTWSATSGNLSSTTGQSVNWTAPSDTGRYTINLVVEDPEGAKDEASKTIRVYRAQDTQPPTVSITYPSNNDTIRVPSIKIAASATDNVGVKRVEFYVDNNLIGQDSISPYEQNWSIVPYPNGSAHSIYAKAYDLAGNSSQSGVITVRVINRGYVEGENNSSIPIYDLQWSSDPVNISGAPTQAVVDTVTIAVDITHSWPSDLIIELDSPSGKTLRIWEYDYPGGWAISSTTYFAGEQVNGTWTLRVYDDSFGDEGTIDYFGIGINWKFQ